MIETDEKWDLEGSIRLIRNGDIPKTSPVTLTPRVVQTQELFEIKGIYTLHFNGSSHAIFQVRCHLIGLYFGIKEKEKIKNGGNMCGVRMTRIGRVYTPEEPERKKQGSFT